MKPIYKPKGAAAEYAEWAVNIYTGTSNPNALWAIVLTDDKGGDYTYFNPRDLGKALNFNVSYLNGQVVINTSQPYSDAQ